MKKFKARHVERSYSHELDATPDKVFPLLCPVREYEWIDIWECELVHSISGVAELGCVFTTELPERGKETWVVCGYVPDEYIEFVLNGPGRVMRYKISLEGTGKDRSRITWTQVFTGLDGQGNDYIATLTPETYKTKMRVLNLALNHFLLTGTILPMQEAMQSLAHS